ncbi:uncharacterized protein PAC_02540 [Phialocephala subalpina]|uniref:Uncharacterized protein n=1 Tax=Phialocephala subalpina TaxID=576137 RepID=A0A1L7WIR0_9HELO|nr:uncharacterized protein PAC_02540 [Phialocephala subalpina]
MPAAMPMRPPVLGVFVVEFSIPDGTATVDTPAEVTTFVAEGFNVIGIKVCDELGGNPIVRILVYGTLEEALTETIAGVDFCTLESPEYLRCPAKIIHEAAVISGTEFVTAGAVVSAATSWGDNWIASEGQRGQEYSHPA